MPYATFEFYTYEYKGNLIAENDFDRLIARAGSYIEAITKGRVSSFSADSSVKKAACAVAEAWLVNEHGGELQSQTVGSWSCTYSTLPKTKEQRLYEAAKLYLANTSLLNRWL